MAEMERIIKDIFKDPFFHNVLTGGSPRPRLPPRILSGPSKTLPKMEDAEIVAIEPKPQPRAVTEDSGPIITVSSTLPRYMLPSFKHLKKPAASPPGWGFYSSKVQLGLRDFLSSCVCGEGDIRTARPASQRMLAASILEPGRRGPFLS